MLWYKELLRLIANKLSDGVAKLVEQAHNGEKIDGDATKTLIDIILFMELDDTDPSRPVCAIYNSILELPIRKVLDNFVQAAILINSRERWIINSLEQNFSRLEVEDKLDTVFFRARVFPAGV